MPGLLAGSSPPARKVLTRDLRFSPSELNNGTLSGLSGEADGLRLRRDQAAGHYLSPALESELPFHFAGIYWSGSWRDGAEPSFWLRTSADGVHWDDWHPAQVELPPGPRAEYQRYGSLIGADGHRYVQFMSELSGGADSVLERIGLTLLNPYDGPDLQPSPPPAGRAGADAAGEPGPAYAVLPKPLTFSRESWGCDESLRFSGGQEIWPRDYLPAKTLVVHHTVTPNGYSSIEEAMAHVRSIYTYHTVTQGWGDIGYNCLIDKFGNTYEGRRGREGPGYDGPYGREFLSQGVVAGHALVYNHGSAGIALLGTFCTPNECAGQAPAGVMIARLEEVLAFESARHGLHPEGVSNMLLRNGNWHHVLPRIVGHRDVGDTSCPGGHVHAGLQGLRSRVAARLTDAAAPSVSITAGPPETTVRDNPVRFEWGASGAGPLEFTYYLEGWRYEADGSVTYIHGFGPDKWPAWSPWSREGAAQFSLAVPGAYTFHVMVRDATGRTSVYDDARSFLGVPVGAPDSALLQGSGPAVYVLQGGLRRLIPNAFTFEARGFRWGKVNRIPDSLLNTFPLGRPLLDVLAGGNLLKGSGPAVYVMQGGARRWITGAAVMSSCGYGWDAIYGLPDSLLFAIPETHSLYGPPCPHFSPPDGALIKGSRPNIYLVQRGIKRRIPNALTFEANGQHWGNVDVIADSNLLNVPTGEPVLDARADGNLLKGSGPAVYAVEGGRKRHVVSADAMAACGYGWDAVRFVSDGQLATLATGASISGPPCPMFMPTEGSLIKGSGPSVYVIEASKKRSIQSAAVFETCHYRWGNVSTIPDSALTRIPSGSALSAAPCPAPHLPEGALVKGSGPAIYVIHQSKRRHIVSAQLFQSCHYDWADVMTIADSTLSSIPLGAPLTTCL
jgi:N-acetylmuramoyl-L-alanine amidase